MTKFKIMKFYIPILFTMVMTLGISAQEWRRIVPLHTTCDDVKAILKVDDCKIPVSNYKIANTAYNINFSNGDDEWNVPRGTVTGAIIRFQSDIKLKELGVDLEGFEIVPEDDLPNAWIYRNDKKGIRISVQTMTDGGAEKYVTGIQLYPSKCG